MSGPHRLQRFLEFIIDIILEALMQIVDEAGSVGSIAISVAKSGAYTGIIPFEVTHPGFV